MDKIYGSEKIFELLIKDNLKLYRNISRKIVNSNADADDAVQNALIQAWNNLGKFRNDHKALSSWIARIVINESYNILRKRVREQAKIDNVEIDDNTPNYKLAILDKAIEKLPEMYRNTIHIAVLNDIPASQAAQILECNVNTVYQRVHKAKELLKEIMGEMENE